MFLILFLFLGLLSITMLEKNMVFNKTISRRLICVVNT